MSTVVKRSINDSKQIANTIASQLNRGVLWSLGASDFTAINSGLRFNARILPFLKNGDRGTRARKMFVEIVLNSLDYYDVRVVWFDKFDVVEHYKCENVDVFSLNSLLLSLDYDGDEVLNPRM